VELAKLSLWLLIEDKRQPFSFLDHALRCGDSLIGVARFRDGQRSGSNGEAENLDGLLFTPIPDGATAFHWSLEFPEVFRARGGFDAILGNPPWGQKDVADSQGIRQFIRRTYRSCAGIYDLFRPFIERGVQLLKDHGVLGMVLPDIILLKNYPETRTFLLEHLTLRAIDWWGQAFDATAIDTVTLVGVRAAPAADHEVQVCLHQSGSEVMRRIAQTSFAMNPLSAFNLHLTPVAVERIQSLQSLPTLAEYFEIHEGVHSGNVRAELFVEGKQDDTCREMYFGRDEIRPYALQWRGRHVRLGALLAKRNNGGYANFGRSHWFEQPKVLVRRTGDYVLAAPDLSGRYASNNFFVVFPRRPGALNLFGLCGLLNSRFMTWFFRTIEPRQGRAFAELKIKHMARFPLPPVDGSSPGCEELNRLGECRAKIAATATERVGNGGQELDAAINDLVDRLLSGNGPIE
jgi:hypothetical protein